MMALVGSAPVDLNLLGAVVNPLGKVSVVNTLGSINVTGTISALSLTSRPGQLQPAERRLVQYRR